MRGHGTGEPSGGARPGAARPPPLAAPLAAPLPGPRLGYGAAMRRGGRVGDPGDPSSARLLLRRCAELGVRLIDTADSYGDGVSETIIAEALHPYPPGMTIATKAGVRRTAAGAVRLDGSAAHLRAACEGSLRRLRLEAIELYQLHWPDPALPLADQVGTLAELRREGKIRHVGLCNVDLAGLVASEAIVPIAAAQVPFGLASRDRADMLDHCAARGIAFIAAAPLAILRAPDSPLTRRAAERARRHGVTLAQLALAWVLRQGRHVFAIPGTLSPRHLEENIRAGTLPLELDGL